MINYKKEIVVLLKKVFTNVYESYPADFEKLPCVTYEEESNTPYAETTAGEAQTLVAFRFDLWSRQSLSEKKIALDAILQAHGLKRVFSQDVNNETNLKHTVMRYEAVLDTKYNRIYKPRG